MQEDNAIKVRRIGELEAALASKDQMLREHKAQVMAQRRVGQSQHTVATHFRVARCTDALVVDSHITR